MDAAAVIFPHQLFSDNPCLKRPRIIYLVEDQWFFSDPVNLIKFHQQKLLLHRASMQAYRDFLESRGYRVHYLEFVQDRRMGYLFSRLRQDDVSEIVTCQPVERGLTERLSRQAATWGVKLHFLAGDHQDARRRFSTMGPLFQELGDRHRLNMIRSELAHVDRYEGQLEKAESAYRDTILQWKRLGHRAAVAHQLESFASIAQARQDSLRAARLYGAAEALRERIGIAMTPIEQSDYDVRIARLRAGTDAKDLDQAWKDGRAMSLEQAVAFALKNKTRPLRRLSPCRKQDRRRQRPAAVFHSPMIFR